MPPTAMGVSDIASIEVGFGFFACFHFMINKEKCFLYSSECTPHPPTPPTLVFCLVGLAGILVLMLVSPNPSFTQMVTRFVLALNSSCHTTQGITPGLHLPLITETVFIVAKCTL